MSIATRKYVTGIPPPSPPPSSPSQRPEHTHTPSSLLRLPCLSHRVKLTGQFRKRNEFYYHELLWKRNLCYFCGLGSIPPPPPPPPPPPRCVTGNTRSSHSPRCNYKQNLAGASLGPRQKIRFITRRGRLPRTNHIGKYNNMSCRPDGQREDRNESILFFNAQSTQTPPGSHQGENTLCTLREKNQRLFYRT